MKLIRTLGLCILATFSMLAVACSNSGQVNTSTLEASFEEAPAEQKTLANKAVAAIKSADYEKSLNELQRLAKENLSEAQKQAVKDTIAQVQEVLKAKAKETVDAAKDSANKAVDDLSKTLSLD